MDLRTVRDLKNLKGKRVLLRVDFDVPIIRGQVSKNGLTRIKAALPTISLLRQKGARIILVTHLGRPKGRRAPSLSVKPVVKVLEKLLDCKIKFAPEIIGLKVSRAIHDLEDRGVLLLENVRFFKGEEKNDQKFAQALASLADLFINDAFAVSHRSHASIVGVTKFLPSYAGLRLADEIKTLSRVLVRPSHPLVIMIGGVKIETKLPVIKNLIKSADKILIGGALANTFFAAKGHEIGKSLVNKKFISEARGLLRSKKIILPVDLRITSKIDLRAKSELRLPNAQKLSDLVVDLGPKTVDLFGGYLKQAKTLIWNGPLGRCEIPRFAKSTRALALIFARRSRGSAFGLIGGGDTLSCLQGLPGLGGIDFISTGGGAMLEYLCGKTLPGIQPLIKKYNSNLKS